MADRQAEAGPSATRGDAWWAWPERLVGRAIHAAGGAADWLVRPAGWLAYRRGEIVAIALLAGSLGGGAAVERWRDHHRDLAARLEAEPPRLGRADGPGL